MSEIDRKRRAEHILGYLDNEERLATLRNIRARNPEHQKRCECLECDVAFIIQLLKEVCQ
jgi:hypothetical protein